MIGRRARWAWLPVAAMAAAAAQAPASRTIWALEAPNRIIEHDAATFAPRRTVPAPRRVLEHPEYLRTNRHGQFLFTGEHGMAFPGGDMAAMADHVWVWDGAAAHEFPREDAPDTSRQWFLSADGQSLYAFENRFAVTRDRDGIDRAVRTSGRLWRTDLAGGHRQLALDLGAMPSCPCSTGVCSESCPEWDAWAPSGVVDAFLLITTFIPGQLQADYQASTLYRRDGQAWRPTGLPLALEHPLAASADGRIFVTAIRDAGCCGWNNESSDQLVMLRGGRTTTLVDEFARYGNQDYDASVYATAARLSPGGARLAYTLAGDAPEAGGEIRLSSDGKDNPQALARLRAALGALPAVEITRLDATTAAPVVIPRAVVVDWLSETDLVVAQNGTLAIYSEAGVKRRDTPIAAGRGNTGWVR